VKKSFFIFALLAILLIPSQIPMLKNYHSLDGLIHTERIIQFDKALKEQQFPVRLAPTIIDSIGYPLFVVNYQLPYYFAEIIMFPSSNAPLAYKATMSITFILSSIFIFLLFREISSLPSALVGTVLFTYLPYRFGDLYQRGAFGESVSMMFVPLIIFAYHRIQKDGKYSIPLLALATFGLITSHTIVFMIFAPLLILYIPFILKPNLQNLKSIAIGLSLGLTMSSFQILPSLFEKNYMKFDQTLSYLYKDFYLNIYQLLRIPHEGINYGTYYQVGIAATLVIFISMFTIFRKFDAKLFFFLGFAVLSIFLATSGSSLLWTYLPFIKYILYPYRFLDLTIFAVAFLAVILIEKTSLKTLAAILLISLTIYTNRHFFSIAPWFAIPPGPNLTTQNENDTIWSNPDTFVQRPLVSSEPQSNIYLSSQKSFDVKTQIITKEPTDVIIRKMYFPGWTLKVNGQNRPITIKDGLISTNLEPGNWQIEAYFTKSKLRMFADLLTLASFFFLFIIFIKPKLLLKI